MNYASMDVKQTDAFLWETCRENIQMAFQSQILQQKAAGLRLLIFVARLKLCL